MRYLKYFTTTQSLVEILGPSIQGYKVISWGVEGRVRGNWVLFYSKLSAFLGSAKFTLPTPAILSLDIVEFSYYRRFWSYFRPSKQSILSLICPLQLPRLLLAFQTAENRPESLNAAYISTSCNLPPIATAGPLNIKINSLLLPYNHK